MDNKSLVEEYKILLECIESHYVSNSGPIGARFEYALQPELKNRVKALDRMVEYFNEIKAEYESEEPVIEGYNQYMESTLKSKPYHRVVRSSLEPLSEFLDDETREYFEAHGGFQNAHKTKFTVWKPLK